jgi:magnesium transporter
MSCFYNLVDKLYAGTVTQASTCEERNMENLDLKEQLSRDTEELRELFKPESSKELDALIRILHPADIAELVLLVDPDYWPFIIRRLSDEIASEVFENLPEPQRENFAELISLPRLAAIVEEMETDDAADLLAELPQHRAETILGSLDKEDAEDLQKLLTYPEDSAGGIMQTELASVHEGVSVASTITELRILSQDVEELHVVYVLDDEGGLKGLVQVIRLLFADPGMLIDELIEIPVVTISPFMDQEEVARLFRKYDLVSAAVVDEKNQLIGRILIDDIVDVLDEEASEDMLMMAGTSAEDLVYGNQVFRIAWVRLPWLITNLFGGLLTGYLLSFFELVFVDALVLISFVPVITAMGGNVGTQSATIVIRGFALGKVQFRNLNRTLIRELGVGLVMGISCGTFVGFLAHLWEGSLLVGFVVGIAMMCAMTVAAFMGVLAPSFFKFIGTDPAIAAGPFVTTANDVTGILIYLGVAAGMLKLGGL